MLGSLLTDVSVSVGRVHPVGYREKGHVGTSRHGPGIRHWRMSAVHLFSNNKWNQFPLIKNNLHMFIAALLEKMKVVKSNLKERSTSLRLAWCLLQLKLLKIHCKICVLQEKYAVYTMRFVHELGNKKLLI